MSNLFKVLTGIHPITFGHVKFQMNEFTLESKRGEDLLFISEKHPTLHVHHSNIFNYMYLNKYYSDNDDPNDALNDYIDAFWALEEGRLLWDKATENKKYPTLSKLGLDLYESTLFKRDTFATMVLMEFGDYVEGLSNMVDDYADELKTDMSRLNPTNHLHDGIEALKDNYMNQQMQFKDEFETVINETKRIDYTIKYILDFYRESYEEVDITKLDEYYNKLQEIIIVHSKQCEYLETITTKIDDLDDLLDRLKEIESSLEHITRN
jgi:hypothetical protein